MELLSEEEFVATIGCYTYPDEFKPCIGENEIAIGVTISQQAHKMFGLSYRTKIVNDTNQLDHGFKIHLIYNALAGVATRDHTTINETPELEDLSYDITTTKVPVTGGKPTSHLIIDSTKFTEQTKPKLNQLLDILYGKDGIPAPEGGGEAIPAVAPRLPMPDEVADIIKGI